MKTDSKMDNKMDDYKIINLEKEYVTFWQSAKGKSFDEQVKLWDEIVEKPHPDFYNSLVWSKKQRKDWRERKEEKLKSYFKIYGD